MDSFRSESSKRGNYGRWPEILDQAAEGFGQVHGLGFGPEGSRTSETGGRLMRRSVARAGSTIRGTRVRRCSSVIRPTRGDPGPPRPRLDQGDARYLRPRL